ncbi:hypothetical protein [Haliangium sp.]|uniref:hypothetical protein n=1 Tax=Haliangium sp. TaxID=2663208 RepID=UPI003D0A5BBF
MSTASSPTRARRVSGRLAVVVVMSLVAAAVVGAWGALGGKPRATGITTVVAIDDTYAVLVREVSGDPERSFLSLFDAGRGEVWGALIPTYGEDDRRAGRIATTAGVISVRTATGGVPYVHAFEAARGAKLGRLLLTASERVAHPVPGLGSVFGDGWSFEFVADDDGTEVTAIELEPGRIRWRRELGPGPIAGAWLRGPRLVVYRPPAGADTGHLDVFARDSGEPAVAEARVGELDGDPCVLDDRAYARRDGAVVAVDLGGGGTRPVAAVPAAAALTCGRHGELDLLVATDDGGQATLTAIEPDSLALRWRLPLAASSPDALPLAPDSGRRVPAWPGIIPVLDGAPERPRLTLVDLARGAIQAHSEPDPRWAGARVFVRGPRVYLWAPAGTPSAPLLASWDGATGALDAAVAVPDMAPLTPAQLAPGRLWLYLHGPERSQTWVVLDAVTLAVAAAGRGDRPSDGPVVTTVDSRRDLAALLSQP